LDDDDKHDTPDKCSVFIV